MLDFLTPISTEIENFRETLHTQSIGKNIICYQKNDFPSLENVEIVIVGVLENRGFSEKAVNHNEIRKNCTMLCSCFLPTYFYFIRVFSLFAKRIS